MKTKIPTLILATAISSAVLANVDTEIVTDCSAATLQSIIKEKTSIDSVIHSDGWRGYTLTSLGQTLMAW